MDFANKLPEDHSLPMPERRSDNLSVRLPSMVPWPMFALAIVGPTATGKSALALALAEKLDGEIVNGDAFQCYQGMAIGTAQPSALEQANIPHHLYGQQDWRMPGNVAQYVHTCWQVLAQISQRNKFPIICGGTGLYVRCLRFGLSGLPAGDPAIRSTLEQQERQEPGSLYRQLVKIDPIAAQRIGATNLQRIIRALEVWQQTGQPISLAWQYHQHGLGLAWPILVVYHDLPDLLLRKRMEKRIEQMWQQGWLEEVQQLQQQGISPADRAMQAVGYREIWQVAQQKLAWPVAREHIVQQTWQLIRRQRTWFRKEPHRINWLAAWSDYDAQQLYQHLYLQFRASLKHYSAVHP